MFYLRLLKLIFARTADRTGPIIGDIFKSGTGCYPIVRIARSGIIFIGTDNTGVFFHLVSSLVRLNQAFHKP